MGGPLWVAWGLGPLNPPLNPDLYRLLFTDLLVVHSARQKQFTASFLRTRSHTGQFVHDVQQRPRLDHVTITPVARTRRVVVATVGMTTVVKRVV